MDQLESFFTQSKAEEGVKLPLVRPDGSETEHWLHVRGTDSDVFRMAERAAQRKGRELGMSTTDSTTLDEGFYKIETEVIASLVKDWSFDKPCTPANVIELFTNAPQIRDMVNRLGAKRALFFSNGSNSSEPSPDPSSS